MGKQKQFGLHSVFNSMLCGMYGHILDFDYQQLQNIAVENGFKAFRGRQLFEWLHARLVFDPGQMTDLPADFKQLVQNSFTMPNEPVRIINSKNDSTAKLLFNPANKGSIEAVWLPYESRQAVCVSVQSGCSLNCSFCATGKMPFKGNLSTGEILEQVYFAQKLLNRKVTNVVFMGMGEPFYNYDNSIKAAHILNHDRGQNISTRRITFSTSGVLPQIKRFFEESQPFVFALSLHSLDPEKRAQIMDIQAKYDIGEILDYIAHNREKIGKKHLTIEYIMISGFNMSDHDAQMLIKQTRRLNAKINLIPVNTDFEYLERPDDEEIKRFWQILYDSNVVAINRRSPGYDIEGACGMLAARHDSSAG